MTAVQLLIAGAFVAVAGLLAGVEWAARRPESRVPTLGDLCSLTMSFQVGRVPVGRVVILGFWWWIGWHFFAR